MTSRRAGTSAVVLTVLVVGVMLLMIMFAARTGPQRIIHGTLVDPNVPTVHPSLAFPTIAGQGQHHPSEGVLHDNPVFRTLGWLLRLALAALVVWGLWRGLLRLRESVVNRRRPEPKPEHVDFDVLDDPEPVAEEIREDADEQLALLLGGSPRNAIVACWDRFEEQAERAHVARRPWETSSEFTLRLLERVSADPAAVARLESLYHEARFSSHEIDETSREAAVEALHAIHLSLGVRAVPG
jgi:Domain of unknown function (DUF4129)